MLTLPTPTVMGKTRAFNEVYSIANEILRKTFGMEMTELKQRVEESATKQKNGEESTSAKKKGACD